MTRLAPGEPKRQGMSALKERLVLLAIAAVVAYAAASS